MEDLRFDGNYGEHMQHGGENQEHMSIRKPVGHAEVIVSAQAPYRIKSANDAWVEMLGFRSVPHHQALNQCCARVFSIALKIPWPSHHHHESARVHPECPGPIMGRDDSTQIFLYLMALCKWRAHKSSPLCPFHSRLRAAQAQRCASCGPLAGSGAGAGNRWDDFELPDQARCSGHVTASRDQHLQALRTRNLDARVCFAAGERRH